MFCYNEQIADKNHAVVDFFDISGAFDFFQVSLPSPTIPSNGENKWRNLLPIIREHALSLLKPDMVLLPQSWLMDGTTIRSQQLRNTSNYQRASFIMI